MKQAHIKEKKEKQLRKVEKRLRKIQELQHELGYKKMEKPIRHGWFKEVVLTSKIERYRNYEHIITAFKKCKIQIWGADKGKAEEKWNLAIRRHEINGSFRLISQKSYNKLPVAIQKLFRIYAYINHRGQHRYKYYLHISKECYRVKYTKAYVTHSKIIDPSLESEKALLEAIREKNGYYNLNAKGWNNWKRGMKIYEYIPAKRGERQRTNARLNQLKGISITTSKEELLWQN